MCWEEQTGNLVILYSNVHGAETETLLLLNNHNSLASLMCRMSIYA